MSVVSSVYAKISRVDLKRSFSKAVNVFSIVFAIFTVLNTLNVYASVEEYTKTKIGVQESFVNENDASTAIGKDTGANTLKTSSFDMMSSSLNILRIFTGVDGFDADLSLIENDNLSPMVKQGLIGFTSDATLALYKNQPNINIPNHLAMEWVPGYDQSVRSTIAATDGYDLLTSIGIADIWESTRMLAYVFFVVILMAAGFMIMFRQKIGGQLMISVFNTLPGVIIGLVAVTFSFAIVGLALNLGMLLVNVVGNFLDPSGQNLLSVSGPFSLLSFKNIEGFITTPAGGFTMGASTIMAVITGALAFVWGGMTTGGTAIVAGVVAFLVVLILVACIVLWASVKVYITVLTAYVGIILDTVMGPLYLVASALPGKGYIGGDWFKRVLRNTLSFPLVFFFINLGGYILATDISFAFPAGLVGETAGSVDAALNSGVGILMKVFLTLILFFVAAESPKFLSDIFPTNGGKGAEAVLGGTKASLSKIPLIGGFFG
ncbi:hypothetical protein HYV12_04030 [Candidatus Dojkabacteria bacterium]|nr:hypothetical protein [Candidatus Dojkabacteria bacterium]